MPSTFPPAVTGKRASYRFVDNSGDKRAVSVTVAPTTADADLVTLGSALAAASNANLYAVEISTVREAAAVTSGASIGPQDSVYDNMTILYKDVPNRRSQSVEIPAPLDTLMVGQTDQADVGEALLVAVFAAADAVMDGEKVSVRYTERSKISPKTGL